MATRITQFAKAPSVVAHWKETLSGWTIWTPSRVADGFTVDATSGSIYPNKVGSFLVELDCEQPLNYLRFWPGGGAPSVDYKATKIVLTTQATNGLFRISTPANASIKITHLPG